MDAPCRRIETAFQLAGDGDVIKLAGGPHPSQPIPTHAGSAPRILIEPAEFTPPGESEAVSPVPVILDTPVNLGSPSTLSIAAENVTLRGLQGGLILFQPTAHGGVFEDGTMVDGAGQILIQAAENITVRNSTITGSGERDPIQIGGGSGHVIEDNIIGAAHLAPDSQAHLDCLQIFGGSDITIRRNHIFGCAAHALFIKADQPSLNITNVTVENNFIQDCVVQSPECGAFFAIQVDAAGTNVTDGVKFIHNTIDGKMLVRDGVTNAEWTGNIIDDFQSIPTDCLIYGPIEHNLIRASNCDVIPPSNTIGAPAYVQAQTIPPSPLSGPDMHLDDGSLGINAGSPATLTDDIDTDTRTAPFDLGADETDVSPPPEPSARVSDGLLALYEFGEGSGSVVSDSSGVATPLDLVIDDVGDVSWGSGSLTVDAPVTIRSSGAADKVNAAVKASGEITVEAWVSPADLVQSGPARVMTVSSSTTRRNVTLGQSGNRWDTRLRTTATSTNGTPSLTTPSGSATLGLTHLLYTRDTNGTANFY